MEDLTVGVDRSEEVGIGSAVVRPVSVKEVLVQLVWIGAACSMAAGCAR